MTRSVVYSPRAQEQLTALYVWIAEQSGYPARAEGFVSAILDFLPDLISKELNKPGLFQLPGLLKIEKKKIPAQKAIKNWKNPFTGEIQDKPAQPAKTKVAVRALKNLKGMV